jgi:hypothetical protein
MKKRNWSSHGSAAEHRIHMTEALNWTGISSSAPRGGEDLNREIRDAMADWLEADPTSMLPGLTRRKAAELKQSLDFLSALPDEMYYGPEDAVRTPGINDFLEGGLFGAKPSLAERAKRGRSRSQ